MSKIDASDFTVVIPAKNESEALPELINNIINLYSNIDIVVVNDGSTDNTEAVLSILPITVISHPYSKGNGAAIKTGVQAAKRDFVVFMDGDGQHQAKEIINVIQPIRDGFDMCVGARTRAGQATRARSFANRLYNRLASMMSNKKIEDLTSGFRAVRKHVFLKYLFLLPNGFSYPTTSTMCFLKNGYTVKYVGIDCKQRSGNSHISPIRDGVKFLLIILKIGMLYSPLKFFSPISLLIGGLGIINYAVTFFTVGTFTNMSALLLLSSVTIFLFGFLSEQLTLLIYK